MFFLSPVFPGEKGNEITIILIPNKPILQQLFTIRSNEKTQQTTDVEKTFLKRFCLVCRVFLPFKKRFYYVRCLLGNSVGPIILRPTVNVIYEHNFFG